MDYFLYWLAFSIIAGWIASNKGRSGIGFFFLAVILSPLIGIVAALVAESRKGSPGQPSEDTHKKCPHCAEQVLIEANVCKHCGRDIKTAHGTLSSQIAAPALKLPDDELMARHGITFDGTQYRFRGFAYDRLSDAVTYAERQSP